MILCSGKTTSKILINEIMYDPDVNDNYYEWIELYNPTDHYIDLLNWTITDNYEVEFLEGDFDHGNGTTIIPPKCYVIITDHGTKFYEKYSISNETIKLYVDDSSIGNGLGNSGDKLVLKNETGDVIDEVEWIIDYEDVPGFPACSVLENHSLSRINNVDTDDSYNDFYESSNPTPGAENKIELKPRFNIELCPEFIPKVENNLLYSHPFAIKISMSNYPSNVTFQIRTLVTSNLSSNTPATQTWNGTDWQYSTYYTSTITTDNYGNWSGWQFIRFKKDYNEYEENIKENFLAYLKVKIKNDNITDEISKIVFLLDMDESTKNATAGGYVTGVLLKNQTFLQGKTVIIENETGNITGVYLTEDNKINEGSASIPGYYKITSKTGSNYNIKVFDENVDLIKTITNITVKQGKYKVNINSNKINYSLKRNETLKIPIVVENLGDLNDTIFIEIKEITQGWNAIIDTEKIILNAKETGYVFLQISSPEIECKDSSVTIFAVSENDAGEFDEIKLSFNILAPDLIVKDVKIYNEQENESYYFGEGEIVKIKAVVKNIGNENATNVNVTFYYDYLDEKHLIDYKNYDLIGNYQKYPTVTWDTKDVLIGIHTIFVIVEQQNNNEELTKTNNIVSVNIEIFKTSLSEQEKDVLIVEIYYNTHPKIHNEFITLYNPSSENIDISGWYITKDPVKTKTEQTKIVFPNPTIITTKNYLCVTENASAYTWEMCKKPDFEYNVDSGFNVPKMLCKKSFNLVNSGEVVVLKNCYNRTVDVVVYGKIIFNGTGWVGDPIPICRNGIVIKRNVDQNGSYIDTNSSSDWLNVRKYGIGQSDFPLIKISFYGTIKTFVSPDSSFEVIVNELRNAKKSIFLNMYEFTNIYLCDELINALIRNVSVNILLEGNPVGGITDEEKIIINRIVKYGGIIRFIKNDVNNNVYKRYNFNHGKYLVIDNKTVIVESCNWDRSGVPKNLVYGNREWGVVIKNEFVADFFLKVFFDDWNIDRCDVYSFEEMGFIIPDVFYVYESYNNGLHEPIFNSETIIENFTCIPVFSPDTSYKAISELIDSANESIYVQQLYIYKNWENEINPFVEKLVNKSKKGVDVKIILNYNSYYDETNEKCNETKQYFDEFDIQTKFIYSNWSIFSNIHNKGIIVDNKSVLISSINWNENSVFNNREAGVIIVNEKLAKFYADVFFYDWNLHPSKQKQNVHEDIFLSQDYKNIIYIVVIFTFTFVLIIRDWRKRQWI